MDIKIGQVWSFKTDTFHTNQVVIHRIAPFSDSLTSVHVTVKGAVPVSKDQTMALGHLPFEYEAFLGSLDEFLGESIEGQAAFEEGYEYWKSDGGGVFTVSIHDAIAMVVETNSNPDSHSNE